MRYAVSLVCLGVASLLVSDVRAANNAVIFMYHHVSLDTPESTSTPPEEFVAQLDWLDRQGFRVLPLIDVLDGLDMGRGVPDKAVVITFDDGYRSVLTDAAPELARRGWPFTVFVNTAAIDGEYQGYLSWDELRSLGELGATIGNHSVSHAHLVRRRSDEDADAWRRRVDDEIGRAEARLQTEVEQFQVPVFAYPYGEYTAELAGLVGAHGLYGLGQHSGAVGRDSDFLALPRYPVATGLSIGDFALRARSRALPVEWREPERHLVGDGEDMPLLRLAVKPEADIVISTLACYASGQGLMVLRWQNQAQGEFEVRPERALGVGRSKVNCTAQSRADSGVYYWWGHLWMRREPDGRWYDE